MSYIRLAETFPVLKWTGAVVGDAPQKKNGGWEDWASWNRALFVKFMLWCVSRWRDNSPKSPGNAWILSGSNQFAALLTFANISWFLFQSNQSIHRLPKKKIDCTTCKGCAVVSKILYIPARDMMDPLFYHHPLSIQALPTRAHAQLNPFLRQIKVVMNNLLGSETCCPFISSSVDFWQNYLDSRSFWNPMRNSTQKGPLGKSHMNFSDATNEPRRKNGKLAIRFYSSTAIEVPITGWFQKLLNRE